MAEKKKMFKVWLHFTEKDDNSATCLCRFPSFIPLIKGQFLFYIILKIKAEILVLK